MTEDDWFEAHRPHLRSVAFRMLGSLAEADDAVQEAWIRMHRADTSAVDNMGGWLTTVVSRVCLDMLRSRTSRREDDLEVPEAVGAGVDPEEEAVLALDVGTALLVVLDALAPPERVAFVLHDLFAVPFEDVAPIVGRSVPATRQLASRARRRVRGQPRASATDLAAQRRVVDAFLAASRDGNFDALLAVLDPDVVVRDGATVWRGSQEVAAAFAGRAEAAQAALVDGIVGVVVAPRGRFLLAIRVTVRDGRIVAMEGFRDRTLSVAVVG